MDGFAHRHFSLGTRDDGGDLVFGKFPRELAPVLDGPFLIVASGPRDEEDVAAFNAVRLEELRHGFHFFRQIRKGKLDLACRAAEIAHDI